MDPIQEWSPTDEIVELFVEAEYQLRLCITDIKTAIRCRRAFLKHYSYDEPSDMFLDDIRENWKLKGELRRQIFVLHLKHGNIWN